MVMVVQSADHLYPLHYRWTQLYPASTASIGSDLNRQDVILICLTILILPSMVGHDWMH